MFNPFSLKDKNILITGASSGIGRQCAISCSKMGANIHIVGRNEERLNQTYNCLINGDNMMYKLDLTLPEQRKNLLYKLPKLSGVLLVAGIMKLAPASYYTEELFDEINEINYKSPTLLVSELMKNRKINKEASIIFMSSAASVISQRGNGLYSGSKSAILGIVRTFALEFAKKRIRVNAISPGLVETKLIKDLAKDEMNNNIKDHPLGIGYPIDVANACIYFLSDASRWITGTNFVIDGGYCAR